MPAGALIVALIALYLLRKQLKRLWQYVTTNKPKVVWWITAAIIALQLFNPPNMPLTVGVIGVHIDSFQLLVRIIGITILGFIVANQVK
ncbi:hypothetical protein BI364_04230 [Acidihalobacter yilgarnensis]|uniref:Uncharacterized protein n=1 Tax=Acidihalobacter yilgarnensis TaxID=2819280 RepID=A0A1D8ILF0_9GAMM|nr:hypothetical protein BI364_04230 [Acidihalobacter yilgarnensis]